MNETAFGRLEEALLRDAWPHEARNFTPWLAANLDRIAEAIGMPLEFVGSEVAVASFSADILARNPQNDSLVLIENQLEEGDHLHLGQILTYLAGLEAQTVIWVASTFREAHLSAIRWLNEHTVEPYAFFALRVRVVRIGSSPFAPLFEIVERPNDWDRQVRVVAQESRDSTLGAFRREFWTEFVARCPSEAANGAPSATAVRWVVLPFADLVISQYLAKDGVGLFLRGQAGVDPTEVESKLLPFREALADRTEADFHRPGTNNFLHKKLILNTQDRATWNQAADWLHAETERYVASIRDLLGAKSP